VEICSDGADNDCNGQVDEVGCICPDADGDGFQLAVCATGPGDCDDTNATVHPGAPEICTDGLDNDCNGLVDVLDEAVCLAGGVDGDLDGYKDAACGGSDCDDTDPFVNPGMQEICDGKDTDCNGFQSSTDRDTDGDGVAMCAGDCDDTNPGVYPMALEICDDGVDNNCDGAIDAADGQCSAPFCGTRTNPKDPPHVEDLLNPDGTLHPDSEQLRCGKCHNPAPGQFFDDTRYQCQRCHADPADPSDPLNGVLKTQYPLSAPFGYGSAPNVKVHSSDVLGTKYGTWGATCITCHNPHQQEQNRFFGGTYGKLIKEFICFDNQATGESWAHVIQLTAPTGFGSFADGAPREANICETCHTRTNHHRRTGDAPGDLDANGTYVGHNDGADCTTCHLHDRGFKPSCGACHDVPPATGTHLKHFGGTKDQAAYGSTSIAEDVQAQSPVYLFNCGNCHPLDAANHRNGVANAGGGTAQIELYNPAAPAGSIKALNPPTATYTPGTTLFTDSFGMRYTQGTCDNVYCHSNPVTTTSAPVPEPTVPPFLPPLLYSPPWQDLVVKSRQYRTPTWGVDTLACSGCHEYPIINEAPADSAGAGDSHGWLDDQGYVDLHVWNMGFGPLHCRTCHHDTVVDPAAVWTLDGAGITTAISDIPIANRAAHVNGHPDVAFTPDPVILSTPHDLTTASYDPATKSCSDVSCHLNQVVVEWGTPYRWWNSYECDVCHQK